MESPAADSEENIYFRTHRFADWIIRFYRGLPDGDLKYTVGKQLMRSGTAVGALMCEAKRARSSDEFRSKVNRALQEAEEALYWISLLPTADLGSSEAREFLHDDMDAIVAMLVSILRSHD